MLVPRASNGFQHYSKLSYLFFRGVLIGKISNPVFNHVDPTLLALQRLALKQHYGVPIHSYYTNFIFPCLVPWWLVDKPKTNSRVSLQDNLLV